MSLPLVQSTPFGALSAETIVVRFLVAFVLAFIVGFVRQKSGKPIGFGTFIFVALGSCALALTAIASGTENPLPLLGAIVTGIGFLGAGALFRTPDRIVGFTSAATIWVFAVFGLTIGVGEYLIGALVYAAIWLVLLFDRWMEKRWIGAHQRKLVVRVRPGTSDVMLESGLGLPPRSAARTIDSDRKDGRLTLHYSIDRRLGRIEELVTRLEQSEDVQGFMLE